jgi:hypothetical protein
MCARATQRMCATGPPPRIRVVRGARLGRLLAPGVFARLPDLPGQWLSERSCCPLQWRGRTGITPVSVSHTSRLVSLLFRTATANLDPRRFPGKRFRNARLQLGALRRMTLAVVVARIRHLLKRRIE